MTISPLCSAQDGGEKVDSRALTAKCQLACLAESLSRLSYFCACHSQALTFCSLLLLLLLSPTHTTLTYTPWLQSIRTPLLLCSTSPTTLACSSPCTYVSLDRQTLRTTPVDRGGGGVVVRVIDHWQGCLCKNKLEVCIRIAECLCSLPGKRRIEQRTEGREMSLSYAFLNRTTSVLPSTYYGGHGGVRVDDNPRRCLRLADNKKTGLHLVDLEKIVLTYLPAYLYSNDSHPLTLLNISDHFTRTVIQQASPGPVHGRATTNHYAYLEPTPQESIFFVLINVVTYICTPTYCH